MTREDRCGYRVVEAARAKSTRRRRGGTTGSGLAAERAFRESRPFLFPLRQGIARNALR